MAELRRVDPAGASRAGRAPLRELDAATREAIASARRSSTSAPPGPATPAADVVAAWSVFGPAGRAVFRRGLGVDDGTWERARGYALHQAALIIPYYAATSPGFVASARRTVEQVLADIAA